MFSYGGQSISIANPTMNCFELNALNCNEQYSLFVLELVEHVMYELSSVWCYWTVLTSVYTTTGSMLRYHADLVVSTIYY